MEVAYFTRWCLLSKKFDGTFHDWSGETFDLVLTRVDVIAGGLVKDEIRVVGRYVKIRIGCDCLG